MKTLKLLKIWNFGHKIALEGRIVANFSCEIFSFFARLYWVLLF